MADVLGSISQWVPITASFVGGGLAGSLLTNYMAYRRNRIQPVAYKIERDKLFSVDGTAPLLRTSISIEHDGKPFVFDSLYRQRIEIINKGSLDQQQFAFGVTLCKGERAVYVQSSTEDRFHKLTGFEQVCPNSPQNSFDLVAEPFNRGDRYAITIYTTVAPPTMEPKKASLGSREAVRFVEMPNLSEAAAELASKQFTSISALILRAILRR